MNGKYGHLHIGVLPIRGEIALGKINKNKNEWLTGETIVTKQVIDAIIEHLYLENAMYENVIKNTNEKVTLTLLKNDEIKILSDYRKSKKENKNA